MPDKDQVFIFNKQELSLIKNTFADNDLLLYAIRKVFLQFPLTEPEKGLIKMAVTPEVCRVLKKRMLPELSNEFPLTQIPSLLVSMTNDLKTKDVLDMSLQFEAKQIEIKYLTQRFNVLQGKSFRTGLTGNEVVLADLGKLEGKDHTRRFVDMTAYLFLLGYIDPSLMMIKSIAGAKEETEEEQKKRLSRDSTQ